VHDPCLEKSGGGALREQSPVRIVASRGKWSITMTGLKILVAAALISTIPATSVLAQEPAAFQATYPNRDVLNGGALTPAGRLGLEPAFGAAPNAAVLDANAGAGGAGPALRPRRHHSDGHLPRP
jgi:hypothetical protein